MNKTWILFKDELNGFAKSSVMIGMWIGMPLLGMLLYFTMPKEMLMGPGLKTMPMSALFGFILSSLAATLGGTMTAIEIVNEKNKKVYDMFVIRPIRRGALMTAKFFAVFLCVTVALAISLGLGLVIDFLRGVPISPLMLDGMLNSFLSSAGVIAVATAGGVLIGVASNSVLMAVMLVWFGSQNLTIIPALPGLIGFPEYTWIATLLTAILTAVLLFLASLIFRKMEF